MSKSRNEVINNILSNILVNHTEEELQITTYNKGQLIVNESDPMHIMYFVISGKLKVYKEYENGKTMLLGFEDGFNILGDVEYYSKRDTTCTVEVIKEVELIKVDFNIINERYSDSKQFNDYIIKQLSEKLIDSQLNTRINLVYKLETRLASYFYSLYDEETKTTIEIDSLADISNNLGCSYRHLVRSIKSLIELKVIRKEKHIITILDFKKLKELSRGNVYENTSNKEEN
ncbi:cAMP receptor protein [Candidatus Izimaplasma bacterium HR1]|jgi:CRP-like cAMP-binding protein|uniref:Crp/Fnr family transcriptional regulator n=1 Tax=Candidatus Izimoplasma sp. HR1 TaxID=1541959 RepID=UPI0004F7DE18|nr:cAMP receptor protein [Candidatus Izimaplasma bacterium HR1]